MSTPRENPLQRSSSGDRSQDNDDIPVSGRAGEVPKVTGIDGQSATFEKPPAEYSRFETFVTDITTKYLNFDGDIDALIDETLCELGKLLGTDRVTYLEVDNKTDRLIPRWHWFADGIEHDLSVQNVDVSARFPWLVRIIKTGQPVEMDRMDQFPDDAKNERRYCEQLGIQSFEMVPALLGGTAVAALALDNIREPRSWDEHILRRVQLVASIIAAAKEREQSQREIVELQCRIEHAISTVSTAFVLDPEKIDDEIERGLSIVAEALGADLVTLSQSRERGGHDVTHESASDVVNGSIFASTHVEDVFPWLTDRLREDEAIVISTLSDFPPEAANERAAMERVGLESALCVPFDIRGKLAGHLAINTIRQRTWSEFLVPKLKLLGEVFGEAISRRDTELELRKSFKDIKALKEQLQQENKYLRAEIKPADRRDEIIGDSAPMRAALEKVGQVAATNSTVLILGKTGTGKELLARAIHSSSHRNAEVMVTVNCAALPSSLVEAELFGREKGAYTGALSRELGRFEIADGSTILLDEVGELSLELQAKLLRVLEEGEFERLGSSKTLKVDVRVLASTNRDLSKSVEDKEFREDLFYRLNVFPIELPLLRDRSEDIPQLVWTFVQEFSETMGKTIESIPVATMDALRAYSWPGNVREVRNIIERAMILSNGPVLEVELPREAAMPGKSEVSSATLADVEREHILAVVESTGWRIRGSGGAAEVLGLKPTTLEARMKKLGLERSSTK